MKKWDRIPHPSKEEVLELKNVTEERVVCSVTQHIARGSRNINKGENKGRHQFLHEGTVIWLGHLHATVQSNALKKKKQKTKTLQCLVGHT